MPRPQWETIMNGFQLLAHARSLMVWSRSARFFLRPAVLGGLFALVVLGSCGKTARITSPEVKNDAGVETAKSGDVATQNRGLPSAKFAFSTSDLTLIPETTGTSDWVTILSSPIKTPAGKEFYVSGSVEAGLYTQTLVRSKNNKKDTSTASVAIQVRVLIDGVAMPPGTVTYAARTQTLSATLEGAIAGCLTIVTNPDGTQSIVLDPDCVAPEEIELILSTLNAASFNFVASNVAVGTHMVSMQARISSSTSVQQGSASAKALVGKGTLIGEIVRAVR